MKNIPHKKKSIVKISIISQISKLKRNDLTTFPYNLDMRIISYTKRYIGRFFDNKYISFTHHYIIFNDKVDDVRFY